MKLEALREEVRAVCVDLYRNGLVRNMGVGGNVSARDLDSGLIAITPSHVRYDTMKWEDILVVNAEGEVVESKPPLIPSMELRTHLLVYQECAEVNAVIHTHSPYTNVLATLYDEVPLVHVEQIFLIGKPIPVSEYVTPGTEAMARAVVEKLKDVPAMILRNHGPVVVGRNLTEALNRALTVEDASRIYYSACCIGKPRLIPLSPNS
ncbi:MAG: class II aldolase/adducin family protein [Dehalococcoidia bacterium]|nr:class II aldolase/adducin family protein [Dehalococcoidia bacterium]